MNKYLASSAIAIWVSASAMAQSPIIVQPANQVAPIQSVSAPAKADDSDALAAINALEQLKAANDELLKKQQAVLEALDQLQKEADQLRIYAKRG